MLQANKTGLSETAGSLAVSSIPLAMADERLDAVRRLLASKRFELLDLVLIIACSSASGGIRISPLPITSPKFAIGVLLSNDLDAQRYAEHSSVTPGRSD